MPIPEEASLTVKVDRWEETVALEEVGSMAM